MSNRELIKRLEALESQHGGDEANVYHIILVPGSRVPDKPRVAGYIGCGIKTLRQAGESAEACWQRHSDALDADGRGGVTINQQLTEGE
ncbi:hypothetical protein RSO41_14080 [Halomonas sp. I1]|uniref:hypothetical protein n=1 Tax=Halomonas sp. I1 TaxID=393536 RepID=UPI0028DFCBA6|nr:hypothetical protein [Halomonas sp. I1]MDT8895782.1 hypothetical protein [Halomonas sp. I1]